MRGTWWGHNNQRTFISLKILISCLIDSRLMWEWLKSRDGRLISPRNWFSIVRPRGQWHRFALLPASSRTLIKILTKLSWICIKKTWKIRKTCFSERSSRIPRDEWERERQHIRRTIRTHHQYCVKIKTLFSLSLHTPPGLFSSNSWKFVWWIHHPNLICVSDCSFSSLSHSPHCCVLLRMLTHPYNG